ncbi:serpin family protein [Caloranaerobacter sp. DY30410]|uniref:serpin family protein n=1 Tax=Caloranaerobacter sp. DY30410 TaxID=3238305 RepID=UPI003CFF982F
MKRVLSIIVCSVIIVYSLAGCSIDISNWISNKDLSFDKEKIEKSVVEANTQFAFDIFKELNKEDKGKNIFISPFSISAALSMTYQGANGTTKEVMSNALRYKEIDINILNESYKNLLRYLKQVDSKIELDINNSIWIREGENIKEDFLSVNREVFDAYIAEIDFSKEDAADKINNWISDSTKGKIKKMITSPISSQVVMYLINAIYFKGEWTEKFDKRKTFNSKFYTNEGKTKDVMMMYRKGNVEYVQGDDYRAVRLPYGNGKTSMYCILPNEDISINQFIEDMTQDKWEEIRKSVSETKDVILQIPRFKIEYGIKKLNDSLAALGMGEAFSINADFSGIREGIFISRVLHKAVIEVNEEGSEAVGVTVEENTKSAIMEKPITFIVNRPFVFIITDGETGTILFMGKLCDID